MTERRVVMVAYPDVQILDVTGPLEVFAVATRYLDVCGLQRAPRYRIELVGHRAGRVRSSSGLELTVSGKLADVQGRIDTLMIAGGVGVIEALQQRDLVAALRALAPRCRRVTSVCTGAFLLAEAGLLDGRRATTHWASTAQLAGRYPKVSVEADPIFVRDGKFWTSAGVCSGLDMALALVEEDHGRDLALQVARQLVVFLKRPGGQAQFSVQLAGQAVDHDRIREVQAYAHDHPDADLCVPELARRAAMSPRNFARVFAASVGDTPARWIEGVRVEAARRALEDTEDGVEAIAARSGLGSAETLRRAFLRRVRVTPAAYRARFRSTTPTE
jgi:transcriptional regulator GlxA family with amidase domain